MQKPILLLQLTVLLILAGAGYTFGQSGFCQSTALTPVFKQDFGQAASSTATSKAPPGSTNYNYGNVGTDGNYIVTPRVENANKSDWTKGGDHTGNTNGNMFLVNAGGSNSVYFRDTAYNLCQGSTFNFTAWLANANTSATQSICGSGLVYAKVTFNIKDLSGNVLNTITTGNLPLSPVNGPPNWQQYGFQFSLPSNVTTVVFEMVDFYGGGAQCGNDLMLDDILFTACTPQVTANITGNTSACMGSADTITSSLVNSPYVNPAYQWQVSSDGGTTWTNIGPAGNTSNKYGFGSVSTANNGTYRVLVGPDVTSLTSQTCIAASNSVPFHVNPLPSVTASSNNPVCTSSQLNLNASASGGTSPYTYAWSGANNFISTLLNTSKTNTAFADSGYYKIVVTDANGCKDSAKTHVDVTETPVLQTTHLKDTICNNNRANIILSSSINGSYFTWTSTVIQGNVIGNSNKSVPNTIATITDSLNNTGNNIARIRYIINAVSTTGCTSKNDTVYITVQPSVTTANAGVDQILCYTTSATLNGNNPSSGIGVWQQISATTALINSPTINTTLVNSLMPNINYSFVWKITGAANCPTSSDTVSLIVRPTVTIANAGNDSTICDFISGTKKIQLNGNSDTSRHFETGTWRIIQQPGGAAIDTVNSPSASLTIHQTGVYLLEWKISNDNNCTTSADTVQFTVVQKPSAGNISVAATPVCAQGNGAFNANNIVGTLLKWQYKSASLTNNNWRDSSVTVQTLSFNNLTDSVFARIIVASNNHTCAVYDTAAAVFIEINKPTVAGVLIGDSSVCSTANSGDLKVINYIGTVVRWESSNDLNTWTIINNTKDSLLYNNLSSTAFYRAFIQSGVCAGIYTNSVKINVVTPPTTAIAGSNRIICLKDTLLLSANLPSNGIGTWTQLAGDSIHFNDIHSSHTVVTNIKAGNYAFKWTIANNVCTNSTDSTTIIVRPSVTSANAGNDSTICDFISGTKTIQLNGNSDTSRHFETGTWRIIQQPGGAVINAANIPYATLSIHQTGIYLLEWKIGNDNNCTTSADTVQFTVAQKPSAGIVLSNTSNICAGAPLTVTANVGSGNIVKWQYKKISNTNWIDSLTNLTAITFNPISDTLQIRTIVQSINNICNVFDTANSVIINTNPISVAGTLAGDSSVCATANYGVLKIANYVGTVVRWESSNDLNTWTIINNTKDSLLYNNLSSTTFYRAFIQSGVCAGIYTNSVKINVVTPPTTAIAGDNRIVCLKDSLLLNANIPTNGIGTWTQLAGDSIHFNDIHSSHTVVTNIKAGNYAFKWTIANNVCTNSTDSTTIIVNDNAKASFAVSSTTVCENTSIDSTNVHLINNILNRSYEWYLNDTLIGISNQFPKTLIKAYNNKAVIKLNAISVYGCKNDTVSASISVLHAAQTKFNLTDTVGCAPFSPQFNNITFNSNNYSFIWNFGNGQTSNSLQPTNIIFTGAASGGDTIYQIKLTAFNTCDSVSVAKQILVKKKPAINFSAQPLTGCSPLTVTFKSNSVRTDAQYIFSNGLGKDSVINNISNFEYTYYVGNNLIINANIKATNTCGSDTVIIPVQIKPNPTVAAIDAMDSAVCGNAIVLYNHSQNATQFDWSFGDGQQLRTYKINDSIKHVFANFGNYTINIHISNGCSDTIIFRKVYLYPKPNAAFVVTNQKCVGDSVLFTNQSDASTEALWNFGNGNYANTFNASTAYTNPGSFNTTLTTIKQYNLVACRDSISHPVTIIAQQSGHFVTADSVGKCIPFVAAFTNQSTPTINVSWSFGDGNNSIGDTIKHTYTKAGIFKVNMIAQNAGGCKYLDSTIIRIDVPTASVSLNKDFSCVNTNTQFNIATNNTDTVVWNFGDGETITNNNKSIQHVYKKPGTYYPTVNLRNVYGCNILQPINDTVKIDNNKANFGIQSQYVCGSTTFKFVDSSNSYFGIKNYNWNIDNNSVGTDPTYQQTFTKEATYHVSLKTISKYGCVDSIKADVPIVIYQFPLATINSVADACKTVLVNFESQINSRDSIFYRLWNLGNGTISKDSVVKVTYYSAGQYTIKLTVATINQCFDSAYKALSVHPQPIITVTPNQRICRGNEIVIGANGASGYIWKDQNNVVICSNCDSIKIAPTASTTYKLVGYNQWGCSNVASTNINVIQPFNMQSSPNDSICLGSSVRLFASGAAKYQWYPANTLSFNNRSTTVATPLITTTYSVIGNDAYGCFSDTAYITIAVGDATALNIGKDTIIMAGTNYQFTPVTSRSDIKKWVWNGANFNCNNCSTPTAKIIDDVCISCNVTNVYGCVSSDTLCIKTFCPQVEVFVPNAFTPDGDGVNDKLVLQGKGIKLIKSFRVFNRWGEMVFERTNFSPGDPAYGWDGSIRGKAASPDVYVYVVEAICEKGYPALFKGNTAILK